MSKCEIWYMRPEYFGQGILGVEYCQQAGALPNIRNLEATHVHLKDLDNYRDLENVWIYMQGEVWSPNGEARDLIKSKGLAHTSMSVGDIIIADGHIWMVDNMGFELLGDVA